MAAEIFPVGSLWFSKPTTKFNWHRMNGGKRGGLFRLFWAFCVCECGLCCQPSRAGGNASAPAVQTTNLPPTVYGQRKEVEQRDVKNLVLCCSHSVASAMASDTPERYERLTSVSSSVDIDQRDTVSTMYW